VHHCLAGEEACCLHLFFPHLDGLQVDKVEDAGNAVLITARSRAADAACRRCGVSSARVNSRCRRRVHDLPAGGRAVMIDLEVRRFFCGNTACELRTFAGQVPAVTQRHQHRTPQLRSALEAVALALAGRAGPVCQSCRPGPAVALQHLRVSRQPDRHVAGHPHAGVRPVPQTLDHLLALRQRGAAEGGARCASRCARAASSPTRPFGNGARSARRPGSCQPRSARAVPWTGN
jgi:hypothetical protein